MFYFVAQSLRILLRNSAQVQPIRILKVASNLAVFRVSGCKKFAMDQAQFIWVLLRMSI